MPQSIAPGPIQEQFLAVQLGPGADAAGHTSAPGYLSQPAAGLASSISKTAAVQRHEAAVEQPSPDLAASGAIRRSAGAVQQQVVTDDSQGAAAAVSRQPEQAPEPTEHPADQPAEQRQSHEPPLQAVSSQQSSAEHPAPEQQGSSGMSPAAATLLAEPGAQMLPLQHMSAAAEAGVHHEVPLATPPQQVGLAEDAAAADSREPATAQATALGPEQRQGRAQDALQPAPASPQAPEPQTLAARGRSKARKGKAKPAVQPAPAKPGKTWDAWFE